jgi:hypothetical protein
MDQLRKCIDVLRHLAKAEPNRQVLAEQRINEYLREEVAVLRASLERLNVRLLMPSAETIQNASRKR